MVRFLLIFFGTYTAMHAYLFWRVWAAFPRMGWWRLALAGWLVLMIAAPAVVQWMDSAGHFRPAYRLGVVSYAWLAVLFWFCCLMLLADGWNLLARGTGLVFPAARSAAIPLRACLAGIGGLIVVGLVWGAVEVRMIRADEVVIEVDNLPPGREQLTIAQITDVHLGIHTGRGRVEKIVDLVRAAAPDVIVSTGDLIDSPPEHVAPMADLLKGLEAPLGKFAVLGNHEYYLGLDNALEFHRQAGLRVLRGEFVEVGGVLLAGVDDPAGMRRTGDPSYLDEDPILPPAGRDRPPTVLLKHQPRVRDGSLGRFDVQVSGHTHGGQIFPFHLFAHRVYPYYRGLYELGAGSSLFVSRGAGTWGPPLRVGSRPEVTVIRLVRRGGGGRATPADVDQPSPGSGPAGIRTTENSP